VSFGGFLEEGKFRQEIGRDKKKKRLLPKKTENERLRGKEPLVLGGWGYLEAEGVIGKEKKNRMVRGRLCILGELKVPRKRS